MRVNLGSTTRHQRCSSNEPPQGMYNKLGFGPDYRCRSEESKNKSYAHERRAAKVLFCAVLSGTGRNAPGPNRTPMTKLEAIIQISKLEPVKEALHEVGVESMTVIEARGHGRQKGHTEIYRGREYTVDLIPKLKLEMVVADEMVEKAIEAIVKAARTGKIGDGKIFVTRIDDAIRIRNQERGNNAI